jgi:hypothetical protein
VGFVVDKAALGQVFFFPESFGFPCQYNSTTASYLPMYQLGDWQAMIHHTQKQNFQNKIYIEDGCLLGCCAV